MTPTNACARTLSARYVSSEVPPTASDRRRCPSWVLLCAFVALTSLWGCDDPNTPRLIAARFMDDVVENGVPEQGESLLLTFSARVELIPRQNGALHGGLVTKPETDRLGHYSIERGDTPTQIRVRLGRGELSFSARGARGTEEPTQIQVDFDKLAAVAAVVNQVDNQALTGRSNSVPIALQRHTPTQLVAARWRDTDGNYCVNRGDQLLVEFNRDVRLGDKVKSAGNKVPADLFWIPGNGIDRFDDGVDGSKLEQTIDPRVLAITLGSQPHLTVGGVFDARRHAEFAPPSGLAINGTEIRPQRAILDDFDNGVCSRHFVDIEEESDCTPFSLVAPFASEGGFRQGHTVTPLPDGGVLVAGGGSDGPSADCWLRDPNGEWLGPIALKHPRQWHTATYFVGRDGEEGTADDAVILIGGFNGERALGSIEVVLPYSSLSDALELPLALPAQPKPVDMTERFFHTAHLITERTAEGEARARIVLVGGFLRREQLNAAIEEITLDVSWPEGRIEPEISSPPEWRSLGFLNYPRMAHASVVVDTDLGERIVVYGGWGKQGFDQPVEIRQGSRTVLGHVEVIDVELGGSQLLNAELPLRRDHALVVDENDGSLLLIGGAKTPPYARINWPTEETVEIVRLTLIPNETDGPDDAGTPEFTIVNESVGELGRPRHSFGVAVLPSGNVLIIGGDEGGTATDRVELYEPDIGRTSTLCRGLIVPRLGCQVAAAADNSWLIVGGVVPGGDSVAADESIEILYWQGE